MSLYVLVYLIDVLHSIGIGLGVVLVAAAPVLVFATMAKLENLHECKQYKRDGTRAYYAEQYEMAATIANKKSYILYAVMLCVWMLIPSKQTLVTMSGLYIGGQVIESVQKSAVYEKAYNLLLSELDEILDKADKK